jgi:hypothetical protein
MMWDGEVWRCRRCDWANALVRRRCRNCEFERVDDMPIGDRDSKTAGEADDPKQGQCERTMEALSAVLEECKFDLGVLVSLVQGEDGRARVECAIGGSGPPGLGPQVGKLLRDAANRIEQEMNAQATAELLRRRLS